MRSIERTVTTLAVAKSESARSRKRSARIPESSAHYTHVVAHFDIPLDLPHAGRLADRILSLLERYIEDKGMEAPAVLDAADRLSNLLFRYRSEADNPEECEAGRVREEAAAVARELVESEEAVGIVFERFGQSIRNLFECLEMGEEGSSISLRAGENPDSLQRPVRAALPVFITEKQ